MNELLHRIKNNLTLITSMLSLMKEKTTSHESLSILNEISSKINAISEMYKLLNYSIDHSKIPLDEYVRNITSSIIQTSSNLFFKTNLDKMLISSKKAIPLGIVLNELITNTMKHAFIGNVSGNVNIKLKRNK